MNPDDLLLEAVASDYPDIRLDILNPQSSVVFKLPHRFPQKPDEPVYNLLNRLSHAIKERKSQSKSSFAVDISPTIKYRAQHARDSIFTLRLCMSDCLTFDELSVPKPYAQMLTASDLKNSGGLIIISGLPGSGKTATLASTVSTRLKSLGGFAMSIEDPIEMPLSGFHGERGYCEQMQIEEGETLYDKIVGSLRCFPSGDTSMLAIGEIRENSAASELLRIGIDGHLVLTTVHAKDPIAAIHRILTMASQDGEMSARQLLANSLKLVIHQKLVNNKPQITALQSNEKVRATILNGNVDSLKDELRATEMKAKASIGYGN